jgi:hypothetical protein
MLTRTKRTAAALFASAALAVGIAPAAGAQQQGLVNVDIDNVLNDNEVAVTVPINAAANICGVSVAVLSAGLLTGPFECDARGNQRVTVTQ